MASRNAFVVVALTVAAACGGAGNELSTEVMAPDPTSTPTAQGQAASVAPAPTSEPTPVTATITDVPDEVPAPGADWAFVLGGGDLLVASPEGVWQVDRETGDTTLIIDVPATRAFDNGRGSVVFQTTDGVIRAQRGDDAERIIIEPAGGEELTLAAVALRDGGQALVLRRTGVEDTAVEELVSIGLTDGVEEVMGEVGRGETSVSSVSAHNKRVAITHTRAGSTRVSFLNLSGTLLDLEGNPQPEWGDDRQILVADIDEEQTFGWIERVDFDGPMRLVVGSYRNGEKYREVELGDGWRPTHLANVSSTRYVVSRLSDTGKPMSALQIIDRDGTLETAPGPAGFVTLVNAQTDGPPRFTRELEAGLELWCRSQYVFSSSPGSGGDPLPLGDITDNDRAELADGLARWLNPPDENGEFPPAGEIAVIPIDEVALVGPMVGGDPNKVSLALWLRRTTTGWAAEKLVGCSAPS